MPERPGDGKYDGRAVHGIRLVATDRERYDPTVAAVAALVEVHRLHADSLAWRDAHFDRLAGTTRLRRGAEAGASVGEITDDWTAELERFRRTRERYLLYE